MPKPIPPQPQYKLQHFVDYLSLHNHLIGELPKEITVSTSFFNWYKREIQESAKRLGIPVRPLKNDEITFDGIKLVEGK